MAAFQCSQSLPLLCDIHEGVSSLWGRSLLEKSKDQPPSLNNQDQEGTWVFQDTGGNPQPAENRHCGSTVDDHRDDHDEEGGGEDEGVRETSQASAAAVVEGGRPWCGVACHCLHHV